MDQIFVTLKHAAVGLWPEAWQPVISALLSIAPLLVIFPLLFALTTVLERKGLGRMQNRIGPNRVGPYGLAQPLADGLKMLIKEDVVPHRADKVVHFLAPLALVVPVLLAYAVLPFGRNMVAVDLDAGIVFFFAASAATEVSVFMAGWSSRNKYSLLGAMRAIAQMISYEVPLVLSALPAAMMAGSLSTVSIIEAQSGSTLGLVHWNVWTPWGLAGFLLFLIAAAAESNRTPFDIPEAESEIIAGYLTEYSGFKYALVFLGEYLGLFAICGLGITLFLGGWQPPLTFLGWVPSYLWFFAKLGLMVAFFIWLRGTLPRLRADQLMNFAWKFLLPMALVNFAVAGASHYLEAWQMPGAPVIRWVVCALILAGAYVLLGRSWTRKFGPRVYRYAEQA